MQTSLPIISGAGLFHSKDHFSHITGYRENAVTRLRTVLDYELELFIQDGGTTHLNGHSYPIKKGCLLLAQPGDKRQSTLHFSALFIHFNTSDPLLREFLQGIHGFHTGIDFQKYETLLNEICDVALTFAPDSDILSSAKLLALFCNLKKDCLLPSTDPLMENQRSSISNSVEYIKQSYMEPLSIAKIATHCGLSTSYFYKLFYNTTHMTPNNYVLSVRLSAAKSLLTTTDTPVSVIADQCGFRSQAYFSDCFRRHFHMSPRQFREKFKHPDDM